MQNETLVDETGNSLGGLGLTQEEAAEWAQTEGESLPVGWEIVVKRNRDGEVIS
jgi:hypothetical protein